MDNSQIIERLVKTTFWRAVRESVAGVAVLFFSAYSLQYAAIGSAKYYGYLLSIIAVGFILGVVWAFTISRRVIDRHSATDTDFWREAFEAQARLLRLVPVWYVAPLTTAVILSIAPTSADESAYFALRLAIVGAVAVGVIYLNKVAAEGIEAEAKQL